MDVAKGCAVSMLRRVLIALCLLLPMAPGGAQELDPEREVKQRAAESQLGILREQIAQITAQQGELVDQRDGAAQSLRQADLRIAEVSSELRALETQLAEQQQHLAELQRTEAELAQRLDEQRDSLAQLLRATHAQGRNAPLKLLLAQDRMDALGRTLGYLGYFRRARVEQIESLLADLDALTRARDAVQVQQQLLTEAQVQQQQALVELDAERASRRTLLAELEKRFADGRLRLDALGRDEKALLALIERLQDILGDIPQQMDGAEAFASLAGRMPWPIRGKLLTGYGRPLPDGRTSSGWLIDAKPGDEVRAIAHGRVAFADWLTGFGLILILDHGDGYMSLYASNDALIRAAGDWVKRGEVLAIAGSSGGQSASGVYFELRRNGRPVDPVRWLIRR